MGGARSTHGEMRNAYKILTGKPEGKNCLKGLSVDGRVFPVLYLTDHHAMKEYRGSRGTAPRIL
jgi:hypothetical protein